jgi:hypothetical protein
VALHACRKQDYINNKEGWNLACAADLLAYKGEWLSYTYKKAQGTAKPLHPDFKLLGSDLALWYNGKGVPYETFAAIRQADAEGEIPKAL